MIEQFKKDVKEGLSGNPKFLSSKYFYDEIGDKLFVEIMGMPEYYLTRAELEIFSQKTQALIDGFGVEKEHYFELIELGAGDGSKTKKLLQELLNQNYNFDYFPIDISHHALEDLELSLKKEIPGLSVTTKQGDYFEVLSSFKNSNHKKVVLFLGSNIGNLTDELSSEFIYQLGANLKPNDVLLLGVDLIKEKEIVLPAYNDANGITARFNLNVLHRINGELGGDFNLEKFKHVPEYTQEEGIAKSCLVSQIDQQVRVESINKTFFFKAGEPIHTEISRKYNDKIITSIIQDTDFQIIDKLTDSQGYSANYILKRF